MLEPWQTTKKEVWHMHWGTSPVGVINVPLREGYAKYTLGICKWDFISFPSWFPHSTEMITVTWETMWWALGWKNWVTPPINQRSKLHLAEIQIRCKKFRNISLKCHSRELSISILLWILFQVIQLNGTLNQPGLYHFTYSFLILSCLIKQLFSAIHS